MKNHEKTNKQNPTDAPCKWPARHRGLLSPHRDTGCEGESTRLRVCGLHLTRALGLCIQHPRNSSRHGPDAVLSASPSLPLVSTETAPEVPSLSLGPSRGTRPKATWLVKPEESFSSLPPASTPCTSQPTHSWPSPEEHACRWTAGEVAPHRAPRKAGTSLGDHEEASAGLGGGLGRARRPWHLAPHRRGHLAPRRAGQGVLTHAGTLQ